MRHHVRSLIAALMLCAFSVCVADMARGRFSIRVWETDEGLPQNSITSMTQTRDGYLWLGTLKGLVRFDGMRFTVFDERNTPGLSGDPILFLFEDSHRTLWIGTETAGTLMMKDGRVTPAELTVGGVERRLMAACEDDAGAVWLYNASGDIWRYASNHFTPFVLMPPVESRARTMIKEPEGPIWIGTDRRQCAVATSIADGSLELPVLADHDIAAGKLDWLVPGKRGGYWRLANARIEKWTTNRLERAFGLYPWRWEVSAACEDADGNLVVGTKGSGVFWISPDGQTTSLTTNEGLSNNKVLSLVVDREGTVWAGTDGSGLNRVRRQAFNVIEETRGWTVQSVTEDASGALWIGANLPGLGQWHDGVMRPFGAREGMPSELIRSVFADREQRLWVGTRDAGLFEFRAGRFRPASAAVVQAIHEDRQGHVWFGTVAGLLRREEPEWKTFTGSDGLSSDVITAIADDADGNLWIGTRGGGLNRLRDGQFTALRKAQGFPSDDISALWADAGGVLWIGTPGSGLVRLHGGKITRYSMRDGLISDSINYLIEDGEGDFWLGSNAGVMRVPKKELNDFALGTATSVPCRGYGKADGLPIAECSSGSQPAAWRSNRDGTLWFPTIRGLAFVDPALIRLNTNPPPVVIESVSIDGEPLPGSGAMSQPATEVTLRPEDERLEIQYASLNLGAPERARFRYRLEGHETDWIEAGDGRVARYSKLPPGEYAFRVIAANEDGVWNNVGSTLRLMVEAPPPPLWRRWWFITVTVVCLLGIIIGVVHLVSTQRLQRQLAVLKQQEALERERARIARDIHDQVGASLTQVALLGELVESDKDSPADVQSHAQQISQTARETTRALDEIVWTVNPSNDTLEGLINYICKYAQDYLAVAGVRYRLDVPAELPALPVSPELRHNVFLAAKEAITNIVRHAKASSAWIRLRLGAGSFTLEIEDDGRGLAGLDPKAAQLRHGLKNMRKRMEEIGGGFDLVSGQEGGAVVRLTAPLNKEFGTQELRNRKPLPVLFLSP